MIRKNYSCVWEWLTDQFAFRHNHTWLAIILIRRFFSCFVVTTAFVHVFLGMYQKYFQLVISFKTYKMVYTPSLDTGQPVFCLRNWSFKCLKWWNIFLKVQCYNHHNVIAKFGKIHSGFWWWYQKKKTQSLNSRWIWLPGTGKSQKIMYQFQLYYWNILDTCEILRKFYIML